MGGGSKPKLKSIDDNNLQMVLPKACTLMNYNEMPKGQKWQYQRI